MTLPPELLRAISAEGGCQVAFVLGAGCSFEAPTALPLSRHLALECHRTLVEHGILDEGDCADPSDLSLVADAVFAKHGSQDELVRRMPRDAFANAEPNNGYRSAAALLRERAVCDVITLNFDLAIDHALSFVSARGDVAVISAPSDISRLRARNVVHLHGDVRSSEDDWVLRTEQIEEQWRDGWEQLMTIRVMTTPVVVFAGLGTSAAVLVDSVDRIRGAIGDMTAIHVDPEPFGSSEFTSALAIPEDCFVQRSWGEFMEELSRSVMREHLLVLERSVAELLEERGAAPDEMGEVFDALSGLTLWTHSRQRQRRARSLSRYRFCAESRTVPSGLKPPVWPTSPYGSNAVELRVALRQYGPYGLRLLGVEVRVMSRAPRPCVAKLNDQRMRTSSRFWKPIRYQRWTTSQAAQAGEPLSRTPLTSATAAPRPIVARLPLSR